MMLAAVHYSPPASRVSPSRQPKTEALNMRVSAVGKETLEALQDYYGVSGASIIEMLLRDRARELELKLPVPKTKRPRNN